jgi:hypothetical protein
MAAHLGVAKKELRKHLKNVLKQVADTGVANQCRICPFFHVGP